MPGCAKCGSAGASPSLSSLRPRGRHDLYRPRRSSPIIRYIRGGDADALPPMIVLIDNYDSFTYNLVQKLGEVSPATPIQVFRNDKVTVDQVEEMRPTHVVI